MKEYSIREMDPGVPSLATGPNDIVWVEMIDEHGVPTGYEATPEDIESIHRTANLDISLADLFWNTENMIDHALYDGAEEIIADKRESASALKKTARRIGRNLLGKILYPINFTAAGPVDTSEASVRRHAVESLIQPVYYLRNTRDN
jgi:hypothetical protein